MQANPKADGSAVASTDVERTIALTPEQSGLHRHSAARGDSMNTITDFPGEIATLDLSVAQLAYLRFLLLEDLKGWAEALAEQAERASQSGGVDGEDARDTFRRLVTTDLLDLIGWDTRDDAERVRWLERKARERFVIA